MLFIHTGIFSELNKNLKRPIAETPKLAEKGKEDPLKLTNKQTNKETDEQTIHALPLSYMRACGNMQRVTKSA